MSTNEYLYNSLEKLIKYPMSLEYKYHMRCYIHEQGITPENDLLGLLGIANSGHAWFFANATAISKTRNLSMLLSLCDGTIKQNGHASDELVILLGKIFNNTVISKRSVIDCYDCGTVARAVFLSLIHLNRGAVELRAFEVERLRKIYNTKSPNNVSQNVIACKKFIMSQPNDCVLICSINLDISGHVFILEKTIVNNVPKYHIYQACLNGFTLLDYIEQQDYINEKSINIAIFFDNLLRLMQCVHWKHEENIIFTELFSYLPNHDIKKPKNDFDFMWSYIIYSER
jgi:hypothetical protein